MHKCVAVLVLLAACGDDGVHHLPDAPPAPDGSMADAQTGGPVTLTVIDNGAPIVGLDVYFQGQDGTLIAKVPTDAQGVASTTMDGGGYVTVVNPFPEKRPSDDLRTFGGVKPGDHLRLHREFGAGVNITFIGPIDLNSSSYDVYSSCGGYQNLAGSGGGSGSASAPTTPMFFDSCGATADFAIVSRDANGAPSQYVVKRNVAVAEGGTVDLSGETYTAGVPTVDFTWMHVPAAFDELEYRNVLVSNGPFIDQFAFSGVENAASTTQLSRPPVAGATSLTVTHPTPVSGVGDLYVMDWAPAAATVSIDLAGALLGSYMARPMVDVTNRTVTWSTEAGATPDFVYATVHGDRLDPTPASWSWQITVPFGATTFTLPKLPADLDVYNYVAEDDAGVDELITAKVPGGYDAVRAELLSSQSPDTFVAGASGRISYETIFQPPPTLRAVPRAGGWRLPRVYSRR